MQYIHTFPPVWNAESRILILGSFPSVKSREEGFFYGHPQNRFWKLIAQLTNSPIPNTIEEKRQLLLSNHIALWDVCAACDVEGSSDASIRDVIPNDISLILSQANIAQIFTNGKTADKLYRQYMLTVTGITATCLPSTSPANAAWTLPRLADKWNNILQFM
ncbi:MAG: DNA-deoxyinosine glycosylase [Clostridiales bacterium]|nr:DNA-deoxyinosine glycosylase [Clostridiales bacterium]